MPPKTIFKPALEFFIGKYGQSPLPTGRQAFSKGDKENVLLFKGGDRQIDGRRITKIRILFHLNNPINYAQSIAIDIFCKQGLVLYLHPVI